MLCDNIFVYIKTSMFFLVYNSKHSTSVIYFFIYVFTTCVTEKVQIDYNTFRSNDKLGLRVCQK